MRWTLQFDSLMLGGYLFFMYFVCSQLGLGLVSRAGFARACKDQEGYDEREFITYQRPRPFPHAGFGREYFAFADGLQAALRQSG